MSLQIYKPNAKNAGCACSFRFGVDIKSGEPVVFINAIQQHSWDDNKKIGSFSENRNDPDKSLTVKLNEVEVKLKIIVKLVEVKVNVNIKST